MKKEWKLGTQELEEKQKLLTKYEKTIGHMIAPVIIYTAYSALSGQYLLQFYTDVLGLAGGILVWMPLLAKMVSSITGLIFGRLIDRTRTRQGKARPWVLFSGVLLSGLGVLLYCVPPQSHCAVLHGYCDHFGHSNHGSHAGAGALDGRRRRIAGTMAESNGDAGGSDPSGDVCRILFYLRARRPFTAPSDDQPWKDDSGLHHQPQMDLDGAAHISDTVCWRNQQWQSDLLL